MLTRAGSSPVIRTIPPSETLGGFCYIKRPPNVEVEKYNMFFMFNTIKKQKEKGYSCFFMRIISFQERSFVKSFHKYTWTEQRLRCHLR